MANPLCVQALLDDGILATRSSTTLPTTSRNSDIGSREFGGRFAVLVVEDQVNATEIASFDLVMGRRHR
jgi:hypothetical protein